MGGRSKQADREQLPDRWQWVRELDDLRLARYGAYSQIEIERRMAGQSTQSTRGHNSSEALNFWLAKEYKNRNGDDAPFKK